MNRFLADSDNELVIHTNAELQAEERVHFCREAAIRFKAASFNTDKGYFRLSAQEAWQMAEKLWDEKPEYL